MIDIGPDLDGMNGLESTGLLQEIKLVLYFLHAFCFYRFVPLSLDMKRISNIGDGGSIQSYNNGCGMSKENDV